MIIDNFNLLSDFVSIQSDDKDTYYIIDIIKRKKDDDTVTYSSRIINSYVVDSKKSLLDLKDRITKECMDKKARAYLRMNRRSYKYTSLKMLVELSNLVANDNDLFKLPKIFTSVSGKFFKEPNKKWLIDFDSKDEKLINQIIDVITETYNTYNNDKLKYDDIVLVKVPTFSGFHLLTKPFNLKHFRWLSNNKGLPNLEIHKDSPTLLYYNITQ